TTSAFPTRFGGLTAVMDVEDTTVTLTAATSPNVTTDEVSNPVPVTVTDVPPTSQPAAGLMPLTVGSGGAVQANTSSADVSDEPAEIVDVPFSAVVTTTSASPTTFGGLTAMMEVEDSTVTLVAGTPPNVTTDDVSNP